MERNKKFDFVQNELTYNYQIHFEKNGFKDYLDKNIHLKSFFNYLNKNKINFQFINLIHNSFLILKILTLDPKFFFIVLDTNDARNFLVEYDKLNLFHRIVSSNSNKNKNFYIIFIDPSIKSIKDVRNKTKYIDFNKLSLKQEFKRIYDTNVKILIKKELRRGLPLGIYKKENKMNELTGKEWIKFTKTWFIHNPVPRKKVEYLHPAKFPESLIEKYIKFFTKERELVLDPFIGTGSTALASKNTFRSCIGIEINKKYVKIAKSRITQKILDSWVKFNKKPLIYEIINEDSKNLEKIWKLNKFPPADFCITSPPYWNQLKRDFIRQKERKKRGLDTFYSNDFRDISNIDDYREFIKVQKEIFDRVYQVLRYKGYLVIITNNLFFEGKLHPLAFDTATSLSNKWILKDEQIWCQDNKKLIAMGVNNAYVGNRHHVYCLIFRKEEN